MPNRANDEQAKIWAEWLIEMLDDKGWSQADLVTTSGSTIRADRVSKWVNAKEKPTHRYAVLVANTLGVSLASALSAAGFLDGEGAEDDGDLAIISPSDMRLAESKLEGVSTYLLIVELLRREVGASDDVQTLRPRNVSTSGEDEHLRRVRLDPTKLAATHDKSSVSPNRSES